MELNVTIHQTAELPTDREPEPGTAIFCCGRGIRLPEWFKQPTYLLGCQPDTRILHADRDAFAPGHLCVSYRHIDGTVLREFTCIAQKIQNHLSKAGRIRVHSARRFGASQR